MSEPEELAVDIAVPESGTTVSGLVILPEGAKWLLVLAHGAGAGMRHPFMTGMARRLAERGGGTLRYQFPYMEAGRGYPDRQPLLLASVRAAVAAGRSHAGKLPVLAGGKSMGGRMTSLAAAEEATIDAAGLIFLGFPLHAPGKAGTERAAHLSQVRQPMLFVQGTRDSLANLGRLVPIIEELPGAELHVVDGGDHSFRVLKSTGRTEGEVLDEVADAVAGWAAGIV